MLALALSATLALQAAPAFGASWAADRALGEPAAPTTSRSTLVQPAGTAVVDYPGGYNSALPARLKAAGVGVVIRYVGASAWKSLTRTEANALRAKGIDIAAVYETSAGWMLGGRAAGVSAAKRARAAIINCGGPRRPFVYFACDTGTQNFAAVNACLAGAASVLGADRVGIYGSYYVCDRALKSGYATKAWQTIAWSGGHWHPRAVLFQKGAIYGSLGVDYDGDLVRADDIGQWGGYPWAKQTSHATAGLSAVDFTSVDSGWAVGDAGTIRHTPNGGATWTTQTAPTSAALTGVDFVTAYNGWAVGDGGTILRTANAGAAWALQSTPTSAALVAVRFSSVATGWAVGAGGTILRTGNGGATWTAQSVPTTAGLTGVDFVGASSGWAVGEGGTILHTGDAGATWALQAAPTTVGLSAVDFTDAAHGWAVGEGGTILRTANGGSTWVPLSAPTTASLTGVSFSDALRGTAVGDGGLILRTTNGGSTWTPQISQTSAGLSAVRFADASNGWAVGAGGTIVHTTNGGASVFGTVAGVAYDTKTGARIPGLSVRVGSRPAVPTATDGSFVVGRVTPGSYTLTFSDAKYITTSTVGVQVSAGSRASFTAHVTPRAVTSLTVPSAVRALASGGATGSVSATWTVVSTITPASAAVSAVTTLDRWHWESHRVWKRVSGKLRLVRVYYWRPMPSRAMAGDASGRVTARMVLATGRWTVRAHFPGSGRYLRSYSTVLRFWVK